MKAGGLVTVTGRLSSFVERACEAAGEDQVCFFLISDGIPQCNHAITENRRRDLNED